MPLNKETKTNPEGYITQSEYQTVTLLRIIFYLTIWMRNKRGFSREERKQKEKETKNHKKKEGKQF